MSAVKQTRRRGRDVEESEQRLIIQWARLTRLRPDVDVEPGARVADYLYAVPNGGKRGKTEAARMNGQGVKAGVSDLVLPLARGGHFGLYLELKKPFGAFRSPGEATSAPSPRQIAWRDRMAHANYRAVIAYGADDAIHRITGYLTARPTIELIQEQGRCND